MQHAKSIFDLDIFCNLKYVSIICRFRDGCHNLNFESTCILCPLERASVLKGLYIFSLVSFYIYCYCIPKYIYLKLIY